MTGVIARMLAALVLSSAAGMAGAQDMSCPPSVPEDLSLRQGPACSMSQGTDRASLFTLSEAEALGSGIVLQDITQNFGCGYQRLMLVTNCATDEIAVFQEPVGEPMTDVEGEGGAPPDPAQVTAFEGILADVRAGAESGAPVAIGDVVSRAAGAGLPDAVGATVGLRLTFNGWTVPTDCGCALHYPEMGQ